jgi:hypothetical protein
VEIWGKNKVMKKFLHKWLNYILSNWLVVILAIIVGLFIVLPTIISIKNIGADNFKGIYPVFNKDEVHYLAMTHEVSEGHSLGNVFLKEYKDKATIQPQLVQYILAFSAKIFNVSIPKLFAINDFIIPFAGVIMLFLAFLSITKSKKISVLFAGLFYLLFLYTFGRPINPQLSFIFLALGILLIWKLQNNLLQKVNFKLNILLGIDFGILLYIYTYFWTAIVTVYAVTLLIMLLASKKYLNGLKNFIIFSAVCFLAAIPYLVNLKESIGDVWYKETILRFGLLNTHWPACYFNVGLLFLTLLLLFLMRKRLDKNGYVFSFSLLVSGILLNWQNVITGKYLQFSSHYLMVTLFFITIVLAIIVNYLKNEIIINKNFNFKKNFLVFSGLVIISIIIINQQLSDFKKGISLAIYPPDITDLQKMGNLFNWFSDNTKKDSVIYSLCNDCSGFLPVYTDNNLYFNGYAGYYLMSDSEMEDRWLRQNIFSNNIISPEFIKENERGIWLNKFIDRYQNDMVRNMIVKAIFRKTFVLDPEVPQSYIDRVYEKYLAMKKENIEQALKKYEIDYIVLDKGDSEFKGVEEKLKKLKFIKPAAEINNYNIYNVEQLFFEKRFNK